MQEIWKDIKDYEGNYQVSNLGRVKGLERPRYFARGWGIQKEMILKSPIDMYGYCIVHLHKDGVGHVKRVHRLVAVAFLNHVIDGHKIVIDHKDHNKKNNCADNLQLITHRENSSKDKHRYRKTSKYVGVCWEERRNIWLAQIQINGKRNFLGYFNDEYNAHLAYQAKLSEIKKQDEI